MTMLPTSDDAQPRRDGWFEHKAQWGEVVVGTTIADVSSRTRRWDIIEVSQATHVQYGHTLWMRAREQTSGEEFTVRPRVKTSSVVILTQNPADTKTGAITPPSNADAIMLLVEQLGATHLASRDERTGEITCPDYLYDSHIPTSHSHIKRGLIEHMRYAHALQVDDEVGLLDAINTHAHAHHLATSGGKGGFPHRHTPEDSVLITGK